MTDRSAVERGRRVTEPPPDRPDPDGRQPDGGRDTHRTGAAPRRGHVVDLSPLRVSPAFARLWIGAAVSGIGAQLTTVAVGIQIYDITRSTFAVSLVGGIALLPMVVAGLWGGMLADAFDRRRVLLVSSLLGWVSTLAIVGLSTAVAAGALAGAWPFYLATTVNAVAATISGATRTAVYPCILPEDKVPAASALSGISIGIQLTAGPALAGVLAATIGLPLTFAVDAVLFAAGFLGILGLPHLPPLSEVARPGRAALRDGLAFLRTSANLRTSFLVDIIAMTFGRPYTLFPAVGALVLGGGPATVGVLTASAAVGTFCTGLFSGRVGGVRRYGVAIGRAITVYGACTAAFGLVLLAWGTGAADGIDGPGGALAVGDGSTHVAGLVLACLALAGCGASDEVSAIFRSAMLLTAAPDQMRGRLQGVFMVVVTGGPRIGDLYAGALAAAVALWFPPLLGGVLIIVLIAVVLRAVPGFRGYDAAHPVA